MKRTMFFGLLTVAMAIAAPAGAFAASLWGA
jgi:hypothetical protein